MLATAGSALAWAPEGSATIHPGVMTFTGGSSFVNGAGQCTANFVFTDASGAVYLGQAAHCSSTGGDTDTNGCTTQSLPLGTPIYAGDVVNGGLQRTERRSARSPTTRGSRCRTPTRPTRIRALTTTWR
ncbi:MAG: hypothetical protein ACXVHX_07725 [Solirubrobacteraceae bacterium]